MYQSEMDKTKWLWGIEGPIFFSNYVLDIWVLESVFEKVTYALFISIWDTLCSRKQVVNNVFFAFFPLCWMLWSQSTLSLRWLTKTKKDPQYGNMGCWIFKGWIQNYTEFWPKINIIKLPNFKIFWLLNYRIVKKLL